MAQKRPVVLNNSGQFELLQPGDYILDQDFPQLANANAGTITKGMVVYASGNDQVDKARANAVGTTNAIGFVVDATILTTATGSIQMDGVISATTAEWDALTGDTGGLVKDTFYFVSPTTAGSITKTAPTTAGQFVVCVGIAISTTELKIEIQPRILL